MLAQQVVYQTYQEQYVRAPELLSALASFPTSETHCFMSGEARNPATVGSISSPLHRARRRGMAEACSV